MIVYQIKNIVNNKIYIGATKKLLCQRISQHFHLKTQKNEYLKNDILKYGRECFESSIIYEGKTLDEIYQREREEIASRESLYPSGYNLTNGGKDGSIYCEDSRSKMSLSMIGEKNQWYGKKFSTEHRRKISEASKKNGMRRMVSLIAAIKRKIKIKYLNNGKIYNSCKDASEDIGLSRATISRIISGKSKKSRHVFEVLL